MVTSCVCIVYYIYLYNSIQYLYISNIISINYITLICDLYLHYVLQALLLISFFLICFEAMFQKCTLYLYVLCEKLYFINCGMKTSNFKICSSLRSLALQPCTSSSTNQGQCFTRSSIHLSTLSPHPISCLYFSWTNIIKVSVYEYFPHNCTRIHRNGQQGQVELEYVSTIIVYLSIFDVKYFR